MAKGLHGKPPEETSVSVINILLLVALAVVIAAVVGAAHDIRGLFGSLTWARR